MRAASRMVVPLLALAVAADLAHAQAPAGSTRTVRVDGFQTRVVELGVREREVGEPVVVLFAGSLSPIAEWGSWLSDVAELAPVVSYDRPGIGGSEYDGLEASPRHIVQHAHSVLNALDIPPYVLVGHSWGGALILYFAGMYLDEVVGLVYLDPLDARETICEELMSPDEQECVAEAERRASERGSVANLPAGQRAEVEAVRAFSDTPVERRGLPADPDVPTAVLLGTLSPRVWAGASEEFATYAEAWLAQRVARFGEWVRGLRRGTLIVATDAGHFVHRDAPTLATEAVRRVVSAARSP